MWSATYGLVLLAAQCLVVGGADLTRLQSTVHQSVEFNSAGGGSPADHPSVNVAEAKWIPGPKPMSWPTGPVATSGELEFSSTNEYDAVTGTPWAHLAEPFRYTTLTANSTIGEPSEDVFKWAFADGTILEGRSVQHTFTTLGRQTLRLTQTVVSTGQIYTLDSAVIVKYVRREIRQLHQEDREAFFDTMETLYRLPTAEGNAMYGDDYKGIDFFVQMHLDGAGVTDCDHWHDDAGIMTHHVGYTLLFEQSLQLVNPAVSIPYWEYTIEAAAGLDYYGESEVFGDDWFGNASPENSLHTMDKGRWAYLPVMKDALQYVHNSYGLLRAPWNLDSTPYVTRYNQTNDKHPTTMVACSDYQTCFDYTTMAEINKCLNGETHGPVHIIMGGEWNDPEQDFIVKAGYPSLVPLLTKALWRMGYLRLPESCTVEEHGLGDDSTCRSSCPEELYKTRGMSAYDVLMDTKTIHWIASSTKGTVMYQSETGRFVITGHEDDEEFQDAFWSQLLASICDPGHAGELFTSSAPYDPLFWVIHPTAERFLAWRRKLSRESSDDKWDLDETWGYATGETTGELGLVCDWSDVEEYTLDMPTCSKATCGGHRALDVLPFSVKINGEVRKMSNVEWLEFIYPDNEDLPYVYNEYNWGHCSDEGIDIGPSRD